MIELMLKMTFWLVAAMVLGFVIAWLLSKVIYQKRQRKAEDTFSSVIFERNNLIAKLEKKFHHQKIFSQKLSDDLEKLEKSLVQKEALITTLEHQLKMSDNASEIKHQIDLLKSECQSLQEIDAKRVKELNEFEAVLLRAEVKLEENEKNYKQIIKSLDKEIEKLITENRIQSQDIKAYETKIMKYEEELKIYQADKADTEFIISKDQFIKIEEQLERYQSEIEALKKENSELRATTKLHSVTTKSDKREDESDDGSMVKSFRETYKKITKS